VRIWYCNAVPITAANPFKGRQHPGEVILTAVRWYLRYPLSYEHVSELLAERGLKVDASCIWRWVQTYAPELNKRCWPHLKQTNKSYRVDETYIKVKGQEKYLYRAVDSTGQTIDFLLTAKRDAAAAKRFFRKVFRSACNPIPRVINVDKNPAYPAAMRTLKREGTLPRRVRLRQCKYLNNIVEQDHRLVKKRTWLAKAYGSFQSAWRALQGIETVNMIRKGRVRWVAKGDVMAQAQFIHQLFGIAA
jgi:transposase, IS6 family